LNAKNTVIVVDDDPEMNLAIRRLLNAAGFEAETFPSAEALLDAGTAARASCLVLDINLPGLSGFELRRQLETAGATLPVIFITAYEDPGSQAEAEHVGAVAYLTKPFSGQRLLGAINQALTLA
jgi:FixJ family two-component response regulator